MKTLIANQKTMKTPTFLLLLTLLAPLNRSLGQEFPSQPSGARGGGGGGGFGGGGRGGVGGVGVGPFGVPTTLTPSTNLPVFNLDFPGGTPRQLVTAIESATARPLNAIVPDEYAQTQIPAMKLKGVTVAKLFEALQESSHKVVPVVTGFYGGGPGGQQPNYNFQSTTYGFRTQGTPDEDSVWYFHVDTPQSIPHVEESERKVCQFYQLGPYLDHDYKVEDITTAIETGWKMLGIKTQPTLNFHKETKLLIAVGDPEQLALIDNVLGRLVVTPTPQPNPPRPPVPGRPVPPSN